MAKIKRVKSISNKKEHVKKKVELADIEKVIIKISIEIAKRGEGALFVIGDRIHYGKLVRHKCGKINVFDKGAEKVLKGLAVIDGATIIDRKGNLVNYGVLIKNTRPFVGFGTRHAAAVTASKNGNVAILSSEEERKVKIFRSGRYIMQIDALQKNVEQKVPAISKILETAGAGTLGYIGAATLAPTLGIALIPGIVVFGGSYYAIKSFLDRFNNGKQ